MGRQEPFIMARTSLVTTYNNANEYTGGWFGFAESTRLIFVSGTNDAWRSSQVVSPLRPGGPKPSTAAQPVLDVPGGYHTSDLVTANGFVNAGCAAVQAQIVSQVKEWVREYPGTKKVDNSHAIILSSGAKRVEVLNLIGMGSFISQPICKASNHIIRAI
jgi:hypothetical protein